MPWELTNDRPIYLQLMEQVKLRIISGYYPAGGRLPPVRELAEEAAVNPNTMQKALSELERDGLVCSQRTAGRLITKDNQVIEAAKNSLAREQIEAFYRGMAALGYDKQQSVQLLVQSAEEA